MINKFTLIFIFSTGLFLSGFAQVTHKPLEILAIINKSKLKYDVGELSANFPTKDYSGLLTQTNLYRVDSNDQTFIKKMVISKEAYSEWSKGENEFHNGNYKEARGHYKNVLDIQADYYPAKVQMAKTFEAEEDYEKAQSSFKQAISKNYIDYVPHLLLAEDYLKDNKMDEAVDEITLASVLNRNDTAILSRLREIYQEAGLKYNNEVFTAQYVLSGDPDKGRIKVLSRKGWEGYASCKALWQFEPGYAVSQGEKPGKPSLLEEKECVLNMMAYQDQHFDAVLPPPFDLVKLAIDNKLLDGFIYYEILLPQNPTLAYELPNNVVKVIKNYVMLAHGGQAPVKKK